MALALDAQLRQRRALARRVRRAGQGARRRLGLGAARVPAARRPLVNQWAADHTHALAGGVPVLALDMYEHAYHIDYGAAAGAYVDAFMGNIDWARVYERYQLAVHGASEPFGAAHDDVADAVLLDVRRAGVFEQAATMIPGARWCDPAHVDDWSGELPSDRDVIVYCVYGHEVGRATALRAARSGTGRALPARRHRRLAGRRPRARFQRSCIMKWVTRERPKIDRIACPWLILRFIDRDAEFLYVPPAEVLRVAEQTGATPYDVPGVEMSHVGELCSFDAFLQKYRLADPALQQLAAIVRGADTSRLDLTPQSAGLYAISLGLSHASPTTTRCCATAS